MKDRILFLDIDGVLNSTGWAIRTEQRGSWGIDPDTIPHLQRIVDESDCDIVVSSTWRILRSLADIRGMLIKAGMRHPVPIRDKTPRLQGPRGNEVRAYMEMLGPGYTYVCLDDDSDFDVDQPLVQTNVAVGLTAADAQRCIDVLRAAVTENEG